MIVDVGPRGGGKSTRMISWLKEGEALGESRILLAYSFGEAERLRREYPEVKDKIFGGDEYKENRRGYPRRELIAIDNADLLLEKLLGGRPIDRISVTGPQGDEELRD